jgi:RNA polymerase sigma-70 factor (ECF subfamily)
MAEPSPQAQAPLDARHLEAHRAALTGHCYRMLGSVAEAEDAVQETMVRAWRNLGQFEGRSALRTWLYCIATRVCLDTRSARSDAMRRVRPMSIGPAGTIDGPLGTLEAARWIEPIPDALAVPADADPAEQLALRQSIRLAFVAALQYLPARQRAALLLADVLGFSAADVAESLDMTVAAVNSALQRARATMATHDVTTSRGPLSDAQTMLLGRYVDAFERYDTSALKALLREDATLSMPPHALWLQGPEAIQGWLEGRGCGCRGSRLVPTSACGSPAFGQYRPPKGPGAPYDAWALIVLELSDDRISALNSFLDTQALFPRFGLPLTLPSESSGPSS